VSNALENGLGGGPQQTNKIADESGFIGQDGINLIATIVGKMRHLWTPTTGQSDKGIDGYIELCRDGENGKRVATNFIIQVQSKGTGGTWPNEDDSSFTYKVEERDLKHWLAGNHPVILIVSRPKTNEAYWVSVKEYFSTLEAKKTRTIYFKKRLHRFDESADLLIQKLAIPAEAAVGVQPAAKRERIESNLLPLLAFPRTIYFAGTRFKSTDSIRAAAKKLDCYPGRSWFTKWGNVYSFNSLDAEPWPRLTTKGRRGNIPSDKWAKAEDQTIRNDFVRLLNDALAEFLAAHDLIRLRLRRDYIMYYFAPDEKNIERSATWGDGNTPRMVVQRVESKTDPSRILCYRHHALVSQFRRLGGRWYLSIEPTYHFTRDGKEPYALREDYVAGMKKLEKHQAVRNNVRFWTYWLTHQDLLNPRKENLVFGTPEAFAAEYGINDVEWLSKADIEEKESLGEEETRDSRKIVVDGRQLGLL
jgi:hypothetical protein